MLDVNSYDELRIGLATTDQIREWSYGEVKKPETINYRTLKPEKDGLFCEKVFGPTRDWECACGKYKRVRYKNMTCERCGVKITRSVVRRERMGHIELAAPVTHIWYFKGVPSRLGYLLDIAPKDLEKVIYFAAHMITHVDEEARHRDLPSLEAKYNQERARVEKQRDNDLNVRAQKLEADLKQLEDEGAKAAIRNKVKDAGEKEAEQIRRRADAKLKQLEDVWEKFKKLQVQDLEGDEVIYREMERRYRKYFRGAMGAEAIKERLETFDLQAEADALREVIQNGRGSGRGASSKTNSRTRALKRLKVINAFLSTGNHPSSMVLEVVPVIPPDLRPMVQLDGGRFATSDLNDLYRRVINRNTRLRRLIDLGAPAIIVNNEKRMLQEAVDSLFDNGRRGRAVTGPANRALKSISDMLKGKQGRFRQNLLGKRVDYSGRSVIVVGPQLKLHQCGLPKAMALELFKPFVMKRLHDLKNAQNIKAAKRMVERQRPEVWDVLEEVIAEHPVLLNRAPTLHRLGIQAFEPQLIEGKAIQIHPLVCTAFNADFDGDQMAVHLPLSAEAQAEARLLMLSTNNILKPADGKPVTMPTQEMIIGHYFLTMERPDHPNAGRAFGSVAEALMAFDLGQIEIGTPIKLRITGMTPPEGVTAREDGSFVLDTTLGRALFNEALPEDFEYVNEEVIKKNLGVIVNALAERYPKVQVAATLDNLKDMGFKWATQSGVTVSIGDVQEPPNKREILSIFEERAAHLDAQYEDGLITDDERSKDLQDNWQRATAKLTDEMEKNFTRTNPIAMMVHSGARGNMTQMRQIAAMRGLVANPKGEIIPRPIKSNFREGLTVLEYFISTHGGRKGQADTALRTADSGYLTRRLVDVSQDVIIREEDCGTGRGLTKTLATWFVEQPDPNDPGRTVRVPAEPYAKGATYELVKNIEASVLARCLAEDVVSPKGEVLAEAGTDMTMPLAKRIAKSGLTKVKVRSVLTCESAAGTCALCYGRSLASGLIADVGEAVGIIAAQSIGEPGTQLTMRTFHTGGVAGDDITAGLPRVVELFEARTPKGKAPIAEAAGRVHIDKETDSGRSLRIVRDDGEEDIVYPISRRVKLLVVDGQSVAAGQQLTVGKPDPQDILRILGVRQVQQHLVDEVQAVYGSQSAGIHDKHIEIIIRQMLRRVTVIESGDSTLLPGELIDRKSYETQNRQVVAEGGTPAQGRPVLMGITKASLATESWLSAASFQETTKVLTDAAIHARSDSLVGLKENVILGKLIPAGTGLERYRNIRVEPTPQARAVVYSQMSESFDYSVDGAAPYEEYDYSDDFG